MGGHFIVEPRFLAGFGAAWSTNSILEERGSKASAGAPRRDQSQRGAPRRDDGE